MFHAPVEIIKARIVDEVVPLGFVINAFSHAGPGPKEVVPERPYLFAQFGEDFISPHPNG
jgi:hypothetical protein